jgi:hypothetical protein
MELLWETVDFDSMHLTSDCGFTFLDIEDEMDIDGIGKTTVPEPALEQQLHRAGDYDLLKHLVSLNP